MAKFTVEFQRNECCTNKDLVCMEFDNKTEALDYFKYRLNQESNVYYYSDDTISCMKEDDIDTSFYKKEGYYDCDLNFLGETPLKIGKNYAFGDWKIYRVVKK